MAKIQLSSKVTLRIEDSEGVELKSFNVTFRELTKKEIRKMTKEQKEMMELMQESSSLGRRILALETKVEALDKDKDIVSATNKLEKLYDQADELEEKAKSFGEDEADRIATSNYNKMVGGEDSEALFEYIQDDNTPIDVSDALEALREDVKVKRGKHSGR